MIFSVGTTIRPKKRWSPWILTRRSRASRIVSSRRALDLQDVPDQVWAGSSSSSSGRSRPGRRRSGSRQAARAVGLRPRPASARLRRAAACRLGRRTPARAVAGGGSVARTGVSSSTSRRSSADPPPRPASACGRGFGRVAGGRSGSGSRRSDDSCGATRGKDRRGSNRGPSSRAISRGRAWHRTLQGCSARPSTVG